MFTVQIEHPVPDFGGWKQAFDSDPIGRERLGVRRYRILRPVDDPNFAIVELEVITRIEAEIVLNALLALWSRVEGTVMTNPKYRIVETVEAKAY